MTIVGEHSQKVKEILSGHLSDYDTKCIEEADRVAVMTSQLMLSLG
jgi:hypothetical protein